MTAGAPRPGPGAGLRLFVYGTLLDPDIREVVLGDPGWRSAGVPARLPGHRRDTVLGGRAPALVVHPGGAVDGLVLDGVDGIAFARAVRFEGVAHYRTGRVAVLAEGRPAPLDALAFLPTDGVRPVRRAWDPEVWRRRHKAAFLRLARRHMAAYPTRIAVRAADGTPG